jgi:hypothetical protein
MDSPRGRRDGNKITPDAAQSPEAATPASAPGPRKNPRPETAKPQISEEALAGRNPLGSFAELAAFLNAKTKPGETPGQAPQEPAG